jgi:hypothetical protein
MHRAKYKGVTYRLGQDERRIGRRHRRPTDHTIQAGEESRVRGRCRSKPRAAPTDNGPGRCTFHDAEAAARRPTDSTASKSAPVFNNLEIFQGADFGFSAMRPDQVSREGERNRPSGRDFLSETGVREVVGNGLRVTLAAVSWWVVTTVTTLPIRTV